MATAVKRHKIGRAKMKRNSARLPRGVAQQLEKIYAQSRKNAARHPYKTAGGILLSLGALSGAYFLIRYISNNR